MVYSVANYLNNQLISRADAFFDVINDAGNDAFSLAKGTLYGAVSLATLGTFENIHKLAGKNLQQGGDLFHNVGSGLLSLANPQVKRSLKLYKAVDENQAETLGAYVLPDRIQDGALLPLNNEYELSNSKVNMDDADMFILGKPSKEIDKTERGETRIGHLRSLAAKIIARTFMTFGGIISEGIALAGIGRFPAWNKSAYECLSTARVVYDIYQHTLSLISPWEVSFKDEKMTEDKSSKKWVFDINLKADYIVKEIDHALTSSYHLMVGTVYAAVSLATLGIFSRLNHMADSHLYEGTHLLSSKTIREVDVKNDESSDQIQPASFTESVLLRRGEFHQKIKDKLFIVRHLTAKFSEPVFLVAVVGARIFDTIKALGLELFSKDLERHEKAYQSFQLNGIVQDVYHCALAFLNPDANFRASRFIP